MKSEHWPLLHLAQHAQALTRFTQCNSRPTNGQCTNHRLAQNGPLLCSFNGPIKKLKVVR